MQKQNIETIYEENTTEEKVEITPENSYRILCDLSLDIHTRLEALKIYSLDQGYDNVLEVVNRLCMMYEFSGTKILRMYLYKISTTDILPPFLRSIIATSLFYHDPKDVGSYEAINEIYPLLMDQGAPYRLEFLKLLMRAEHKEYQNKAENYLNSLVTENQLNCDFRYKIILGLEGEFENFSRSACITFMTNTKNETKYRILACQNIICNEVASQNAENAENILLSFAQDEKVEYNTRADATDILLNSKNLERKELAKQIILELGKTDTGKTIYDNAQNVHDKELEKSVKEAIEFLSSYTTMKINGTEINLDYVSEKVSQHAKFLSVSQATLDKIKIAINRISMDKAIYSSFSYKLSHVLVLIYTYISGHDAEKELKKRLIEELEYMADLCSSGFVSNLVNVISGFGDFSVRISWRDQILANITGRLNAKIRDMDNLKLQEKILSEMTIKEQVDRPTFMKFFRESVGSIHNEMYEEFKEYLTDADFELYFKGAMSSYESGEFFV